MLQAGRSRNAGGYRFGFQGQEADNKIGGLGQHLNYTFRNYDSWAIRFGAIDPLAAKYPHNSSYAFSENRVIDGVELEGAEFLGVNDPNITSAQSNKDGTYSLTLKGDVKITASGINNYNGQSYYNTGQNLYCTDKGISTSGTKAQKFTTFFVTEDQMSRIFKKSSGTTISEVTSSLNKNMANYGIDNYIKLAHFLGQVGAETFGLRPIKPGLTVFEENLSYSQAGVCKFSSRAGMGECISNYTEDYTGEPENWGNLFYDRSVLGNTTYGDGYAYRGSGLIHLTGKGNFSAFNDHFSATYGLMSPNFVTNPDLIRNHTMYATISGLWFFNTRVQGRLKITNATTVEQVTRIVNGKLNGLADRQKYFNEAILQLRK